MVANARDRMNKFVDGVSSLVKEECRTTMLHHDTNISRLMVYVQEIEASKPRKMDKDGKRDRSDESSQDKSKKRFYNQDSSMVNKDRASNRNSQGGSGGGLSFERTGCTTCGKQHLGKCLAGKDGYFGCGNKGHNMRDCPVLKAKAKNTNKDPQDGLDPNSQKKNYFYMQQANKGANPE
ncbi:uncharacterized protein LOC107025010 [Solanum pennellii]|uniref:Uncharacterized protein LOC107025010 n=1 Tax=Solanum pennellii TaxID=28526 RepID=A0ABM1H7A5_SOLPN|nr:uncharacterized protein LOC107025010 [Solanum pennellii]